MTLATPSSTHDDGATLIALGALAYLAETLLHEAFGHGGACLAIGGRILLIQSLSMQCSLTSPWVVAAGPAMNALAAVVAGVLSAALSRRMVNGRFALWLLFAFNGLVAAGYLAVGGATGFGDWAVLFGGVLPEAVWRAAAVLGGIVLYYVVLRWAAGLLTPIVGASGLAPPRLLALTIVPGLGAATAALGAVVYGQSGDWLRLGLAVGSSLGVAWSLNAMDRFGATGAGKSERHVRRSRPTIVCAAAATLAFVLIIGPGWAPGG